ncbi:hypothetical protein [Bacteroides zoogleoformans]|uniref:Uncharacterized protein n=1 Tax=Bacteroides zoogleoformans TaxID=28119 RepID=A0ABN5IIE1_9BACE|nr:hypothetical protein [Bacteroides zoogleoformans]AVM52294.1 hypothetical protein C4H11_04455 [Bacteroides zoogleoformans]
MFDYKQLSKPLPKYFNEIITDNNCFGIGYSIRKYCSWKKSYIKALVEHGYFFGSYVSSQETMTFANTILTFGEVRVKHIQNHIEKKKAIPIGPYIHYANQYLTELEFGNIKKMLGRTLLVFFSHAPTGCSVSFDIDYLISKIEQIRHDYDSVVISLFWSDITLEVEEKLLKKDYKIFCSGHRYDYNFLSRQKSMIELSDMTMSNSVGTHIAYCTYLRKPHWIVRQEIKTTANSDKGNANLAIDNWQASDSTHNSEIEELYSIFSEYKKLLTSEQDMICKKYFGFEHIKTPIEMFNLLKSL